MLYKFLFSVLPFCASNTNRRNFGLYSLTGILTEDEIANKIDNIFAMPFSAAEKPSPKSEFSSFDITLCFTLIAYLSNNDILRPFDYDNIVKSTCNTLNQMHKDDVNSSSELENYDNIMKCLCKYKFKDKTNKTLRSIYNTYDNIMILHNQAAKPIDTEDNEYFEPSNIQKQLKRKEKQIELFRDYIKEYANRKKENTYVLLYLEELLIGIHDV